MCGFVGVHGARVEQSQLTTALKALIHRGPDGEQLIIYEGGGIACCRLAITPPLQASPIVIESASLFTLNGELYDLPTRDQSETDTQAGFRHVRNKGFSNLEGMFAIVMKDGTTLQLARDRFGIKPLYWAKWRGGVAFASEMKALLSFPDICDTPDPDVEAAFEALGFNIWTSRTTYKMISAVEPGCCLQVEGNGEVSSFRFAEAWEPHEHANYDENSMDGEIKNQLHKSVKQAILHDPYPKAIFLSGGLDSTLLLHLAAQFSKVAAFTLWDGQQSDDVDDAQRAAHWLGVPFHIIKASVEDLDMAICHYAWHFERPIGGGGFDLMGGVAFHLLARTIASDYRVALCGEGADELFLGYHRYHVEPEFFARELLERIRATGNEALLHWALEKGLDSPNVASALIKLAREQGLSEYHLPSVDASGMAFGLEVRPPYLNNELAKLVVSLPHSALLDRKENWTKRPLRRILNGIGAPDQRASVRRKRAMSYAVETSWRALLAGMNINEQVLTSCLQCAHTVLRRASPYHPPHVKFSELVKSGLLCPSDT